MLPNTQFIQINLHSQRAIYFEVTFAGHFVDSLFVIELNWNTNERFSKKLFHFEEKNKTKGYISIKQNVGW